MALTIGNWWLIGVLFFVGIVIAIIAICCDEKVSGCVILIITIVICLAIMFGLSWWHSSTANGQRAMKDFQSNIGGGLNREIVITAEDGREIFRYSGRVDIETKHDGNANYILFESEDGLRYIIYYGITDTMTIIEKRVG